MANETKRVILSDEDDNQPPGASEPSMQTRRVGDVEASATFRVTEEGQGALEGAQVAGDHHPLGTLPPGRLLCGDCRVERTLYPHESQRPGLYLCSAPEGTVVVKVAAANYPPKSALWQKLVFLRHPHVLRTYRTIEEDGFFFEVQEYCHGGTLESRVPKPATDIAPPSPEWLMETFVPQVSAGLKYLHQQEIVHRDVKPANIYVNTVAGYQALVLGDFDISSVLEQSRTSRDTQRTAGTWYYTAPEAFPRFVDDTAGGRRGRITRSSDYYSLGITIIELLLGTTSLHLCQLPDLFDFYLQGGRVELPQGIPGRLTLLLRGLLIRNRASRWGAAEIEHWLHNDTTDDDLKKIHDDEYYELARASRPYRLKSYFAVDLPSLAEAMFREPELATEDLITGDVLLNWIGNLDPTIAREIRRDRDEWYPFPEMVLMCAIMHCDPTRPFIFSDGCEVHNAMEWIKHAVDLANRTIIRKETFNTTTLLPQLAVWLRLKTTPQPEMADRVEALRQSPPEIQLEELIYLLLPNRPYEIMPGVAVRTPQELVQKTYGTPEEWKRDRPAIYRASYQRWLDGALCAWLRQRKLETLAAKCDEVREHLAEEHLAAFETILRLLDPALPPIMVEVDLAELQPCCLVHYGTEKTYSLRYTTRGSGVPFCALQLQALKGVRLSEQWINQREGTLELTVDAAADMPIDKVLHGTIHGESGFTQLAHDPLRFQYRVFYPLIMAVRRVAIGAGIGAGLLGLPRLLLSLLHGGKHIPLSQLNIGEISYQAIHLSFGFGNYFIAFHILLVCIYTALRIWLKALRGSER